MGDCKRCAALEAEFRFIRQRIDHALADEPVKLTPSEQIVFDAILKSGKRGATVEYLDALLPEDSEREAQNIRIHVSRIRGKLGVVIKHTRGIDPYRGVYMVVEDG